MSDIRIYLYVAVHDLLLIPMSQNWKHVFSGRVRGLYCLPQCCICVCVCGGEASEGLRLCHNRSEVGISGGTLIPDEAR